jgi:hypothetical protein
MGINPIEFGIGSAKFKFKYGGRIQSRYDYLSTRGNVLETSENLYLRRVRFKSNGYLLSEKLGYKLEIDLLNKQILDLVVNWRINQNLSIAAGQWKLRGNRERVISSQKLQFVDRSLLNSKFTLDRDIGIWLMHDHQIRNLVLREIFSISEGEGMGIKQFGKEQYLKGLDYTARLELLPFGNFTNGGDYTGGDIVREKTPKLAIGLSYDFNNKAIKTNGQKGDLLKQNVNLGSFIVDAMFKFRGFSWMTELVKRRISDIPEISETEADSDFRRYYTGNAINTQLGYVLSNNFEIATRYSNVIPDAITGYNELTEYTLGLSKYIDDHKIKVQSDISLLKEDHTPDTFRFRIQFELSI